MLISCLVTAQLICAFVFAYAKIRFSHDAAHLSSIFFLIRLPFTDIFDVAIAAQGCSILSMKLCLA